MTWYGQRVVFYDDRPAWVRPAVRQKQLMPHQHFTRLEGKVARWLAKRDIPDLEALWNICYGHTSMTGEGNNAYQTMHRVKAKLKTQFGIIVQTRYSGGYTMEADHRARLRSICP